MLGKNIVVICFDLDDYPPHKVRGQVSSYVGVWGDVRVAGYEEKR